MQGVVMREVMQWLVQGGSGAVTSNALVESLIPLLTILLPL